MRRLTFFSLLILVLLTCAAGPDRSVAARLGHEVWLGDPKYGATLPEAVAAIGPAAAILRVPPGVHNLTANYTVPANITLKPERGAVFHIPAGKILTLNGGFGPGLYQVFSGPGHVKFGYGSVDQVYPQWWGATADYDANAGTGTDNTAAFQKAVNCLMLSNESSKPNGAAKLKIPGGSYRFAGEIGIGNAAQNGLGLASLEYAPFTIEGDSPGQTYGGGTHLYRSDGGFLFMCGGNYDWAHHTFTQTAPNVGPLTFRNLTISYAGDRANAAAIIAGKPMGVGGMLHCARFEGVSFRFLYRGIDTRFSYPVAGQAGLIDYTSFKDCYFHYIVHRGLILNEPNSTVLERCGFYIPGTWTIDDTNFGPGNGESVSACGLATYGGNPVLVGCGFDGYGLKDAGHDYAIYLFHPYAFDCYGVHSECRRFLFATAFAYPDLSSPANMRNTINFHGGACFNLMPNGINVYAAGKVRFMGTHFYILPGGAPDIFAVGTADFSLEGDKFWRATGGSPAYAEFTPQVNAGVAAKVHIGDVAGEVADIGTISKLAAIGSSAAAVNYSHHGNQKQFGAERLQSAQPDGKGPHHLQFLGSKAAIPARVATPVLRCTLTDGSPASYQITVHYRVWSEQTYKHGAVSFVYGRETGAPALASAIQQAAPEQGITTAGGSAIKGLKWSLSAIKGGEVNLQVSVDTAGKPAHLDYRAEADGGFSGANNTLTLEAQ